VALQNQPTTVATATNQPKLVPEVFSTAVTPNKLSPSPKTVITNPKPSPTMHVAAYQASSISATSKKQKRGVRKCKLVQSAYANLKGKFLNLYSTVVNGQMLTDRHIDATKQLLSDQFPDIQGLSTPLLGQTLTFPSYNCFEAAAGLSYVKVLHCSINNHWLTVQVEFDKEI